MCRVLVFPVRKCSPAQVCAMQPGAQVQGRRCARRHTYCRSGCGSSSGLRCFAAVWLAAWVHCRTAPAAATWPLLPRVAQRTALRIPRSRVAIASGRRSSSSLPLPPGPFSVPVLGSVSVLWALLRRVPLPRLLARLRARYGPLFLIRTGPISQVWVSDPNVLRRIYELPECAGRPVSFRDPFGDFLFLTRDPAPAAKIKERQQAWLDANLRDEAVWDAVECAVPRLWPLLETTGPQPWPAEAMRSAMYAAVTRALLGDEGLVNDVELEAFMSATREYSEMRVGKKFGKGKRTPPGEEPPPGAVEIRRILRSALERAGRTGTDADTALPLVVAASVGGAEIFPVLLHWIFLALARQPERQHATRAAAVARDPKALMQELYAVLRCTAYSVALGPPRKVLADVEVEAEGVRLPAGALLFAMHPAIVDEALGRKGTTNDGFSEWAFGLGPRACLGRPFAEAILPAAVGALLRRYRVSAPLGGDSKIPGELRGQLIHPVDAPPLLWERLA